MLEEAVLAIITGAAGNIVAYMTNGQVDALRTRVTQLFRHGTPEERSTVLNELDTSALALAQHTASEADLRRHWANLLVTYLKAHPEAREDIEDFTLTPAAIRTTVIGAQHNYGSGTFIGGDNYGSLSAKDQG